MFAVATIWEEAELEKCVDFVLRHRRDFYPAYNLGMVFVFLNEAMQQGEIVAGRDEQGEIIGIAGYAYGTPEKKFADKHRLRFQLVCIAPRHRKSGLFLQGLRHIVDHLARPETGVREIEFYVPDNRPDLRKLFSKLAVLTSTVESKFGREDYYVAAIEDLKMYCDRWKPRKA